MPHFDKMCTAAAQLAHMWGERTDVFFLTDWLLRAYERAVLRGLGLDKKPELAPFYFGNYNRLVYLSQEPTERLISKAQTIADTMGWEFEHRHVGYGELESRLIELMAGPEFSKNGQTA